jgi:hypothetical protein
MDSKQEKATRSLTTDAGRSPATTLQHYAGMSVMTATPAPGSLTRSIDDARLNRWFAGVLYLLAGFREWKALRP